MSGPIITVESLGKKYLLRHQQEQRYTALRDILARKLSAPFRVLRRGSRPLPADHSKEEFWALKDLNFEIKPGEVFGIIGRNGAGKSTLLKILSRITEPTTGRVRIRGRVASLLEVGTGFHPELTGRENIFLNGSILGMSRNEIRKKFDEIVAFAEVEKFLDTPVKRYSSGMYVRLAFAVAAHLEPEILIVDEVLAVGDAQFQKKCLGRMGEVAREGRTILFVSHNMVAVQSLCTETIWLDKGSIVNQGPTAKTVYEYLHASLSVLSERHWPDFATAPGTESFRLTRASVTPQTGDGGPITTETPIKIDFEYVNLRPDALINLSLVIWNEEGVPIFNTVPEIDTPWGYKRMPVGRFRSTCYVPANLLNDGTHRIKLFVVHDRSTVHFMLDDVLVFDVADTQERSGWYGKWLGAVRPKLEWNTELLDLLASNESRRESVQVDPQ